LAVDTGTVSSYLNKSAAKNENERSGLSREGYLPRWERNGSNGGG
jgi:hypothetical protein